MSDDPFAAYAQERGYKDRSPKSREPKQPKHIAMSDADAPMVPTPMEKQMRDQRRQVSNFKKAKREEQRVLRDQLGDPYVILLGLLKGLPASSRDLVAHLRMAWAAQLTREQRFTVLSMVGSRIVLLRERDGRPPFDDPLPGQPDNLFIMCRKALFGF